MLSGRDGPSLSWFVFPLKEKLRKKSVPTKVILCLWSYVVVVREGINNNEVVTMSQFLCCLASINSVGEGQKTLGSIARKNYDHNKEFPSFYQSVHPSRNLCILNHGIIRSFYQS